MPLNHILQVYKITYRTQDFEWGGGGGAGTSENLRRTKIRIRNCSTQNQSDLLHKFKRRAKKKYHHSNLLQFLAQSWVQA